MKLGISQQSFGSRASVNIELIKPNLALYIGGMGARNKNFYTDYARRLGFADAALKSRTCTSPATSRRLSRQCQTN